jgi:hypothetical protein
MSRADLEREAEGKYPKNIVLIGVFGEEHDDAADERAAYIQGRLDQAEADARIAEGREGFGWTHRQQELARGIAAAIRKGVEDE